MTGKALHIHPDIYNHISSATRMNGIGESGEDVKSEGM